MCVAWRTMIGWLTLQLGRVLAIQASLTHLYLNLISPLHFKEKGLVCLYIKPYSALISRDLIFAVFADKTVYTKIIQSN